MNIICKLNVAITGLLISSSLTAQTFTQPGTIELGGDISFSSQSYSENGTNSGSALTTFSFNPYLGFMVSDGFELGLMPGIATVSYGSSTSTQLNLFFAPAYNVNTNSSVYPYFEFLIGYNTSSDNSYSSYAGNRTIGGLGVGLDAGLKINLKGNSLLLFKIQYLHQSFNRDTYTTTGYSGYPVTIESREIALNTVSFGMGFRIFIEPREKKK